jgi:hypothetical protein
MIFREFRQSLQRLQTASFLTSLKRNSYHRIEFYVQD